MSDKTEATFHGPPPDDLPQRVPGEELIDWDSYWAGRAEFVRSAPPWVQARRREPLVLPSYSKLTGCDWHREGGHGYVWSCRSCNPSAPEVADSRYEVEVAAPRPAWLAPLVAGAAGALIFFAVITLLATLTMIS